MPTTPTTLPNLPNLAGTNVTPNVPAHVLSDTDITIVNSSTAPGIGADRKVTLGELKSSIVTPITNPIAETVSAITSKAILVDLKDANSSTGVLTIDVSTYSCDLVVRVDNSASVEPPVSPGYFTLQIAGILPAGASLRIANSLGSSEGDELNVRVSFTEPYTYGIGARTLSGMTLLPLLARAFFSATVANDGVTWLGNSVDNVAMAAYIKASKYGRGTVQTRGYLTPTTGVIFTAVTNLSNACISLSDGSWLVSASVFVSNADSTQHLTRLEISHLSEAPAFSEDGSCAVFDVVGPSSGETYGYAQVVVPPKIVSGGATYSIWGTSTANGAVALRGWVITAIPTI